jgi:hypothetical protein
VEESGRAAGDEPRVTGRLRVIPGIGHFAGGAVSDHVINALDRLAILD